jgi:phage-related minor tail protein
MAGTEVGSLYYDLNIDDKNLKKQLDDADKSVKGFGDHVSQYWGNSVDASKKFMLGVTAAAAATVAFGVSSVKAFEESQNVIAQTNAVLKSTGNIAGVTADQVTKLASALEKQTKFSDEDVRSVENLLLTFTSIKADIFPQATKTVLDMATALGEDTKSASIQLGKALQDPINGITALRRVGVNFSDKQKEVIQTS